MHRTYHKAWTGSVPLGPLMFSWFLSTVHVFEYFQNKSKLRVKTLLMKAQPAFSVLTKNTADAILKSNYR